MRREQFRGDERRQQAHLRENGRGNLGQSQRSDVVSCCNMLAIVGIVVLVAGLMIRVFSVANVFVLPARESGRKVRFRAVTIAHKHPARAESHHGEQGQQAEQGRDSGDEMVCSHAWLGCQKG
jgi:hypothetical protein